MSLKRLSLFSLFALLAASALPAFAQKPQAPGTHITVSKTGTAQYPADFTTVQAAVNKAEPDQVIEILDESEYPEQVTIDGRETSPWAGVTGGKNGITIRYVPPAGTPVNSGFARPTIKYKDITNTSPKTSQEAQKDGELVGSGGNFETCGALRIIRAQGVTIEGIAIDGGGPAPFGYTGVWCPPPGQGGNCSALTHGNAAITLVVAGGAIIRNCDIKNAFIGVNVKDRNTGGVFANPNKSDNDETIPISGFGKVGYHLVEHNRIHNNSVGLFFESAWDLSNTVRYNLIYNNYHSSTLSTNPQGGITGIPDGDNMVAAAIMFKDMVYAPMAIYNNTFYKNANNFVAHWKVGATHLIFNNIFSEPHTLEASYMNIDHRFPNRMHNSVLAAQSGSNGLGVQCQQNFCSDNERAPGGCFIRDATITNAFGSAAKTNVSLRECNQGQPNGQTSSQSMPVPGALLSGGTQMAFPIPASANVRWLEMTKRTTTPTSSVTYDLFESVDPANPKFLWPKWNDTLVIRLIKNQGWKGANIRNADGLTADIGAISSAGSGTNKPLATVARIKPIDVVLISSAAGGGSTANASFFLNVDAGAISNPKISFLRWIAPLPKACDGEGATEECNWAGDDSHGKIEVPATAIRDITIPANASISAGTNAISFALPSGTVPKYGFIEIVIEGTDANGAVTTDIGFLPYRELDYILDIAVSGTGVIPGTVPQVMAGEPITLTVTARKRDGGNISSSGNLEVDYNLQSHVTARMWQQIAPNPSNALLHENNLLSGQARTKTYTVYFTRAGDEVIGASGLLGTLVMRGTLPLKVTAGTPDKVVFQLPVSKSQGLAPATISGTYDVEVQVQDRFDNPVNTAVPVTIVSNKPDVGDIQAPQTASTTAADGTARFTAVVTNGAIGDIFDLTASITVAGASKTDEASLRVGRAADGLAVSFQPLATNERDDWFTYWEVPWEEVIVGTRRPVWVWWRNNSSGTITTTKDSWICVTASPSADAAKIKFFASEGAAESVTGQFLAPMVGGVAQFWITSDTPVDGITLTASARTSADCAASKDNSVADGTPNSTVAFRMQSGVAGAAFVRGDANARPNYVEVEFTGGVFGEGGWTNPTRVDLTWPCAEGKTVSASGAAITILPGGTSIGVTFDPLQFPEGYSAPMPVGQGTLVKIFGAIEAGSERSPLTLNDSIGPLIAKPGETALCGQDYVGPYFYENDNPSVKKDTLRLQLTETIDASTLVGASILLSKDEAGAGEAALTILSASVQGGVYSLELSEGGVLASGDWVKLNSALPTLVDASGNSPLAANRRVQIRQIEVPPVLGASWYVTSDATGKAAEAYIVFNKEVEKDLWFAGGSFTFNWSNLLDGSYTISAGDPAVRVIADASGALNTVAINLGVAFSKTAALDPVLTSGVIDIDVKYAPGTGWPTVQANARDRARPVLVKALLQEGPVGSPDTLFITYSEALSGIAAISSPITIMGKGNPTLTVYGTPTPVGTGYMVTYVVNGEFEMIRGDSVKINELAGVTDLVTPEANVQSVADNRRVPLQFRSAAVVWDVKVKNNPFSSTTGTTVLMSPGSADKFFTADVKLYDNMGKLVQDTTGLPRNGNGDLVWRWDGRNKKGRVVGTGTYLFKAVCKPVNQAVCDPEDPEACKPFSTSRKIAFVRR